MAKNVGGAIKRRVAVTLTEPVAPNPDGNREQRREAARQAKRRSKKQSGRSS